ncbi:MAG: hypothetical protein JRE38_01205 [Deltaproteobacteria bacterium]|nr:hypothetical protein [Deltaproteobacteria bacterium]
MAGSREIYTAAWRWCVAAFVATVGVGTATAASEDTSRDFKLVSVMHQSLTAINEINEAVVRDNYKRVGKGAETLKANAKSLKGIDIKSLQLDPKKKVEFNRFLTAQRRAADSILSAAALEDATAVLLGVNVLIDDACVACHSEFRETDAGRTPRALFMRSLLSSVQSVNRGIAMNDYGLIAREAREIGATAHILTWTQVIETIFLVEDPSDQNEFRGYFETLSSQAIHLEHAAAQRNPKMVSAATRRMLNDGCVSCHESFRDDIRERVEQSR